MKTAKGYQSKVQSADKIVNHIIGGGVLPVDKPPQAPESFLKGVSNTGGSYPSGRVYNEMK